MLGVLALGVLGACAQPETEGVATASGQTNQVSNDPDKPADNPEERTKQFVECLRAEGLDVPDPELGDGTGKTALRFLAEGGKIDKAKFGPAMEKCSKYMPEGGRNVQLTPEQLEQARKFAQCMRDNGVSDWPDPDPATGGFAGGVQVNKDDPNLRTAIDKCRSNIGIDRESPKPGTAG
ncbi:hypothetical protein [Allorhizocola rhizosphaerae]|uniref:hypothetical protein n=1 Tax=Allorhizocola rhizosphaerae TaxID=1872709 RepID=UPI000E3C6606|nr:hypothetical protein [Allorhizocola rhizosphaerae]